MAGPEERLNAEPCSFGLAKGSASPLRSRSFVDRHPNLQSPDSRSELKCLLELVQDDTLDKEHSHSKFRRFSHVSSVQTHTMNLSTGNVYWVSLQQEEQARESAQRRGVRSEQDAQPRELPQKRRKVSLGLNRLTQECPMQPQDARVTEDSVDTWILVSSWRPSWTVLER